jgi:hypothetical protein
MQTFQMPGKARLKMKSYIFKIIYLSFSIKKYVKNTAAHISIVNRRLTNSSIFASPKMG